MNFKLFEMNLYFSTYTNYAILLLALERLDLSISPRIALIILSHADFPLIGERYFS